MDPLALSSSISASTINHARNLSLDTRISDPNYKFDDIKQPVQIRDHGSLINPGDYQPGDKKWGERAGKAINNQIVPDGFHNGCFFQALFGALISHGISTVNLPDPTNKPQVYSISPIFLMELSGFEDFNQPIDTDKPSHKELLSRICQYFPEIQLLVYVGKLIPSQNLGEISPSSYLKFGLGKQVIRLLTTGSHFVEITSPDKDFIYVSNKSPEQVIQKQQQIEANIGQQKSDQQLAQEFQNFGGASELFWTSPNQAIAKTMQHAQADSRLAKLTPINIVDNSRLVKPTEPASPPRPEKPASPPRPDQAKPVSPAGPPKPARPEQPNQPQPRPVQYPRTDGPPSLRQDIQDELSSIKAMLNMNLQLHEHLTSIVARLEQKLAKQ